MKRVLDILKDRRAEENRWLEYDRRNVKLYPTQKGRDKAQEAVSFREQLIDELDDAIETLEDQ